MFRSDFTFRKYSQILEAIVESRYPVYTIYDYVVANRHDTLHERYIILRHDVDGNLSNALKMAELEHSLGIRATYYFRMKKSVFDPDSVRKIAELDHEIGYHYEHLPDAKGEIDKAKKIFEKNLKTLRKIAEVKTACMHGRPFSKYDSRDFWKYYKLEDFDLIAEPYLSIDYTDMFYFTDTGQAWDNQKFNIRDVVVSKGNMGIRCSDDLIRLIRRTQFDKAAFLIHTNRWVDELPLWLFYSLGNKAVNQIKIAIKKAKRL